MSCSTASSLLRWQLTIDYSERDTLAQATGTCPNKPVTITLAR
ncbi:hypothetical protein [Streptomyces sp. col6]|nr:hypothetical protein [Streptomyces sp. col6]